MNKKCVGQLGQRVLENTLHVIMNLQEDEKMVLGTQVLTKEQIIENFWKDGDFAFNLAEQLDRSVKEFLFRSEWNTARRNQQRPNNGS